MQSTQAAPSGTEKESKSFLSRIFGDSKDTVNAVDFLKTQHREVEALFVEIESAGDQAFQSKESLALKVCNKLTLHAKLEEQFLYPVVKTLDAKQFFEAEEEHDTVKMVIEKLRTLPSHGANFDAKVKVLKELVEHHVKEEENEMFPLLKKELDHAKLEEIGQKMADFAAAPETHDDRKKPVRKTAAPAKTKAAAKPKQKAAVKAKASVKSTRTAKSTRSGKAKASKVSRAVIASKAKKTAGRSQSNAH